MEKINDIHIGDEIKSRFDKSGLTQREFGARIGMPQQNVWRVFNGESIDTKRLVAVSRALKFNFFKLYYSSSQVIIDGDHNQLNENGSHDNLNIVGDAVLAERVKSLEALLAEKERLIKVLMEKK